MTTYQAHSAKHGTSVIPGITTQNLQLGSDVASDLAAHSLYPQFVALRGQKPTVPITSRAVQSVLTVTGSTGADIDASNTLILYYAAMTETGAFDSTGHRTYTMDRGLLLPRQISCNHQEDATINFEALIYSSDGATNAITIGTAALPTVARDSIRHTLGGVTLAGKTIGSPTSVSIDFGASASSRGSGSNLYDEFIEQNTVSPTITITGIDPDAFAAAQIPAAGISGTHANSIIYLRKRDVSGIGFVADLTAEHIKIDAEGLVHVSEHSGDGNTSSEITIQMVCTIDGSGNAPIGVTASSAIS